MISSISRVLILYVASLIIMVGLYVLSYQHLPPETPLFYSLPESDNQIAPMWAILLIPVMETILVALNYVVKKKWYSEASVFSTMISVATYSIIFLSTYIFVTIILHIT